MMILIYDIVNTLEVSHNKTLVFTHGLFSKSSFKVRTTKGIPHTFLVSTLPLLC